MPRKWNKGEVVLINGISPSVRKIELKVSGNETLDFVPGQFVTFDLPVGEKRLDRWRSYSIVNLPNNENIIELAISYIHGGRASEYFFNEVVIGTELQFKDPEGSFVLPKEINYPLVMICTGTGVAPFKSMISHLYNNKIKHKGVHLIFGTRNKSGILYKDYFDSLSEKHNDFSYSVALSREEYNGYMGYVHGIYREKYKQVDAYIGFYLCGWQNMIDQAQEELLNLGYKREQILFELYG